MKPDAELHLPSAALRGFLAVLLAGSGALLFQKRFVEAAALLASAHAVFCTTAAIPNHGWTGPVVRRFRPTGRKVWLTLDDGPDPESTPEILAVLHAHHAKATFFLIGERAARHPDLVRAIVADGHALGNHSHTHPAASFWAAGPRRIAREIDRATAAIVAAGAPPPSFFRPPVGMANLFVDRALRRRGMTRIGWSARGFDTRPQEPDVMIETVMRNCGPGTIILFHELGATAGAANLDALLGRLRQANLTCELPNEAAFANVTGRSA